MFNVKVEYDSTPVRHIAVQCPECNNWFRGRDITKNHLTYDFDIDWAEFDCPVCGKRFGGTRHADKPKIEEVDYPKVYEDCLERKEVWR